MKSKDLKPLKVSLHGMDERMQKMMGNYLRLPCKGVAVVAEDAEAHAEIVDVDLALSETLLDERLSTSTTKPIIALSLHDIPVGNIIYVKKPIQVPEFLAALTLAKDVLLGKKVLNKTSISKPDLAKPFPAQDSINAKSSVKPKPQKTKPSAEQKPAHSETALESSKDVSDFITQAIQKSEATKTAGSSDNELTLEQTLKENINLKNESVKETQSEPEPSGIDALKKNSGLPEKNPSNIVHFDTETSTAEETAATINKKISPASVPAFLKQEEITFKSPSEKKHAPETQKDATTKDKNLAPKQDSEKKHQPPKDAQKTTQKPEPESVTKATDEKPETQANSIPFNGLFNALWQRKGLIAGLTCLISLILGIYIFQLTPLYEAKARIFIGKGSGENNQNELEKAVAQTRINEITSRLLATRVIKILQLNTIPEFIEASVISEVSEESDSSLRQERKAAEQLSKITDYFLQNLTVTQFKNTPIINIIYKAENPKLAFKVVNELVNEYLVLQQEKNQEKTLEIDDWETNKLPEAKNKLKQSQNALTLYIEMNKWSQFEQQFAEDMGVNSEIRDLEKKVKADRALYEILLKRFDNLKKESESLEINLINNAEVPTNPSYPNRQRLLLITLLSALLISIIIALILSAMNFSGKKIIGEPI